ncbi:TetR/AcrR family transcriptional regulator (plasmid) [Paraclostridium sordellii]
MRSIKSAELIYLGLKKCLKEKPFEKITITDIQNASTVGRATFYRKFDSIEDVLYWKCSQKFSEVFESYEKQEDKKRDGLVVHFINYWTNNSEIIEEILAIEKLDIILKCHTNNTYINSVVNSTYSDFFKSNSSYYDYFISLRIGIFVSTLTTWVKRGKRETSQEIIEILTKQLEFINTVPILILKINSSLNQT